MNWDHILDAAGLSDPPGRIAALPTKAPEPLPADLSTGQPCCVFMVGNHDEPSDWKPGFRIEAIVPGGAVIGDSHLGKASLWVSTALPRCRIHPGATPPVD